MTLKKEKRSSALSECSPQDRGLVSMLETLGYTQTEALVYIYLLRKGKELGGSSIASGTHVHRQHVYQSIKRLLHSGLVVSVASGTYSKYKAIHPAVIERLARRKVEFAGNVVKSLEKVSTLGNEQDFEILQGEPAIREYLLNYAYSTNNASEYIIGGASTEFGKLMGEDIYEYLDEKERKHITVYYLGTEDEREYYKQYHHYNHLKVRFIKKLPGRSTHMQIKADSVCFYSFLNPPLLYVLKSEKLAGDYQDFFMMLWEMGEK